MNDPQSADPAPPLASFSEKYAGWRRAAGQGNDTQICAGRTYGRVVRDYVFNHQKHRPSAHRPRLWTSRTLPWTEHAGAT